jgi:hypothetical protein
MKNTLRVTLLSLSLLVACAATACADGDESATDRFGFSYPATATLVGDKDGVDMLNGTVYTGEGETNTGTWLNSDVYTTASYNDALKLWTGGPRNTQGRPANWFSGAGGVTQVFTSLDAVPDSPKPAAADTGLTTGRVKTGHGFIILAHDETTYFKGFVSEATTNTLTIEYEPLP